MAIVAGVKSGLAALLDPNLAELGYPYFGVSASITTATNAASASIQLPVDAAGNLYSAYLITSNQLAWVNINTAGDAAVAGAANNYLINGQGNPVIIPVKKITPALVAGATAQISAINDSAATSRICVIGIF